MSIDGFVEYGEASVCSSGYYTNDKYCISGQTRVV